MGFNDVFQTLKGIISQSSLGPKEKAAACAYQLLLAYELFRDQASYSTRWDRNLLAHEGFI